MNASDVFVGWMDGDDGIAGKLGEQIALALAGSIGSGGLTIGTRIGTEDELAGRYGVSRWTVREAVAVLEMDGLVENRRGGGGGLYVSAPAASLRVATLRHYVSLAGATTVQINRARAIIEKQVVARAMRRLGVPDVDRLRAFRERPEGSASEALARNTRALQREMLRLADHPALTLFSLALAQANIDRALWYGAPDSIIQQLSERTWDSRMRQVEALIAHDEPAALSCQDEIAQAGIELLADISAPPEDLATAMQRSGALARTYAVAETLRVAKKPEAVARLIAQRIVEYRLQPGDHIGSEAELLVALDVSRNVLREATRLLERYGIAAMHRGQSGGLRATRPEPATIVRATSLYLAPAYERSQNSFHRISMALQLEATSRSAEHARRGDHTFAAELAAYRQALADPAQATVREEVFRFYDFLGRACNDPVLECLMRALVVPVDFTQRSLSQARFAELRELQLRFVDAVAEGDAALARRLALALRAAGAELQPRPRPAAELMAIR